MWYVLCVHVVLCVYILASVSVCTYVWRPEVSFVNLSMTIFQGLSLTLELIDLAILGGAMGFMDLPVSAPRPQLHFQACAFIPTFT